MKNVIQLYNDKGEAVGSIGELIRRAEEARISVKEKTDEVGKDVFNIVTNIFDEPTAGQVLPSFQGLHYLQICPFSKIVLSYKFV